MRITLIWCILLLWIHIPLQVTVVLCLLVRRYVEYILIINVLISLCNVIVLAVILTNKLKLKHYLRIICSFWIYPPNEYFRLKINCLISVILFFVCFSCMFFYFLLRYPREFCLKSKLWLGFISIERLLLCADVLELTRLKCTEVK